MVLVLARYASTSHSRGAIAINEDWRETVFARDKTILAMQETINSLEEKHEKEIEIVEKMKLVVDKMDEAQKRIVIENDALKSRVVDLKILLTYEILRASAFLDRRSPPPETDALIEARMREGARSR